MNRITLAILASGVGVLGIVIVAATGQNPRDEAPNAITRSLTLEQLRGHSDSPLGLAEAFDALAAEADAQWVECSALWEWAAQQGNADQLSRVSVLKNRVQDEFAETTARIALDVLEWNRDPARYTGPSAPEFWQAYRALAQKRDAFRQEIIALRADFYTEAGVNLRKATTSNPFDFKRPKAP